MKKFIILLLSIFCIALNAQEKAKEVKTTSFKVSGNCNECKARIENAADIKGVKVSTWDPKTQMFTVTYRADKVSEEEIKKAIASKGHDAGDEKAPAEAYKKLPECCKYHDTKCEKK
jgi:copper chaperone CopZ